MFLKLHKTFKVTLFFKIYLCYIYSPVQSVLFTVFRTDSVEKINIWVSTGEYPSPGRLKSAYSASEKSLNIEKNCVASCVVCVSSLRCCGDCDCFFFLLYSLFNYYTFQLKKIKGLTRLHGCTGFSVSSFFMRNQVILSQGEVPYC